MTCVRILLGHLQGRGVWSPLLSSCCIEALLHSAAVAHGFVHVGLLVVFFVEDDPSQSLVDPSRPFVEALMDFLAFGEEFVPVDPHNIF